MHKTFILLLCLLIQAGTIFGQTKTVLDYTTLNNFNCNLFFPSSVVNSITHSTTCGAVNYGTNINYHIVLKNGCNYDSKLNLRSYYGTEYKIDYPFKQGYSYNIKVMALSTTTLSGTIPILRLDFKSASLGTGAGCNTESISIASTTTNNSTPVPTPAFSEFDFNFGNLGSNYANLYIGGVPSSTVLTTSYASMVEIDSIVINETPPQTTFTISPNPTSVTCGATTPVTFTATGSNVPSGATIAYK